MERLRIGIIFGGRSGEHDVSLLSARSIIRMLDPSRYDVIPIGISREGIWKKPPQAVELLEQGRFAELEERLNSETRALVLDPGPDSVDRLDLAFPVLHGPYGEDGTVQGFLELAGLPYVGAGVAGSAVSMDKTIMKRLFEEAGLPTVPWQWYLRSRWEKDQDQVLEAVEETVGYPCFVKPANLGSSVGISRADSREALRSALTLAAEYDRKLLVEKAVARAREIEVSVLGNDEPQASLPGEIRPGSDFYDYEAKYLKNTSELIIPARLGDGQTEAVQRLAIAAFQAVDCCGMARVDFFIDGNGKPLVNEINTIPGFTRISMYPKLWEASGLSFRELLDELIALALERHEEKGRIKTGR